MAQTLPSSEKTAVPPVVQPRSRRKRVLLPIALLAAGGGLTAWYFLSRPATDELQLSGRIEGYETDVGTQVPGRVEEVTVREGAQVQKGQLLARLDDDELRAQLAGTEARIQSAKNQVQNAQLQLNVLQTQIEEAQLRLQQAEGDTQGRVSQAEAQVAAAQAQLEQARAQVTEAQAQLELARQDRDRFAQLVQEGAVTQQRFDEANAAFRTAQATLTSRQAAVNAAQRQITAAQGGLTQTQTTTLNPEINTVQLDRLNAQVAQARAQLAAAQAEVRNAEAERQRIVAQLNDLTINSPINGVITDRTVEPGTVVTAGKTLLTVLDLNTVYLRGFIPAGQIGLVRVGQRANVYLDSDPDRPLVASVVEIDSEASFTPENIYFREDRVQQVFGVKLAIEEPGGFAKPGMPADATIEPNR
ncbi:HlyD family efflux transporter periplasmic adaptor subunit [Leptolyngbya sp. FACHB-711]|uniref:HlyD family secretion protein n=1 Tax=unclassified Leptolyngbya TaxID=2650499 RepID=UPI0016880A92|nr:HlyD family efflux transporter periplasmic adaptor subunit [Leptolyngbya sp. FACHB-711]MBD1852856.1 HlyD family secretion protein [Cyanobacteria bacterium FACHB-502]MBD2025090.1 HlyD family secretion protein [Leptolyngbya sp. FACHB-711]